MKNALPLRFHYDVLPSLVCKDKDFGRKIKQMQAIGLSTLWLTCFVEGQWDAEPEDILKAKHTLEEEGFEVQALSVPLGHGSQALDPSQPLRMSTGDGWPCRVDVDGRPWPCTTCIDDKVISDSRHVAETLKQMGFTKIFYDDDLRMGSWGPHMQGCFCERCLHRFYTAYPSYSGMSRKDIQAGCATDADLREAWETIQCDAIQRFAEQTTPDGVTPCFMIMHNGDRRHGLDVRRLCQRFPDALIRVGEGHFGDSSFLHPLGRDAIVHSIRTHLALIGSCERACSESTTYPVGDLSPTHWIQKMRLEISCGLRQLFLMSGTVFLTDPYWDALRDALPELTALAEATPLPVLDGSPYPEEFVWHL